MSEATEAPQAFDEQANHAQLYKKRRFLRADAPWRRRIPTALLPALVELRTVLARRNPVLWQCALLEMRFVLEKTRPDADLDKVAVEYIRQMYWRAERRWRPELLTSQPVEGVDEVLAARDPSRGMVVTFFHHAAYDGAFASIGRAGLSMRAVGADMLFGDDVAPHLKQHARLVEMGSPLINAKEGSAGIRAALERAEVISIAPDVISRTPVHIFGRDLVGSFGAARLAYETNSQVVVSTYHPDPKAPARIRLGTVLEPRDFPDAQALQLEILRQHEAAVVAWPEAWDRPLFRFGWTGEEELAAFGPVTPNRAM
ncbi:hypothetical protein [Trujillonella endophytica]|uniref:KDO2-lipid IV(A) lauroyltransferase n=1 Tax=Trujillonella endophytica TaxID=673521 RepID=A0A1H8W524_9ACTN|nr:hypothetical protein [Trujillella endophytica]SEP22745.1 hypothetical protein SAMN05660991_04076 [Trujillella endophytica]